MPAGLNNSDAMTADVTIPLDVGASAAGMRGYGQPNAQHDNANAANGATSGTTKSKSKGGKKGETLFGPDLGLDENDSEGWVNRDHSKEKVPLSVVKDWVEKAKKEEVSWIRPRVRIPGRLWLIARPPFVARSPPNYDLASPRQPETSHSHSHPGSSRRDRSC
jgi:hypothetical protein